MIQATHHTLKSAEVSFQRLKDVIGNDLGLHVFQVDNGFTVHAKVKTTIRQGLVQTAYLHAIFISPKGEMQSWREQRDGNFKTV